jgi:PAS domain-containing protein
MSFEIGRGAVGRTFRSGQGFAVETRSLRAHDGTYRWHLQQAMPLRDEEGNVLKFVGTTTNIDDQKRAQEAFSSEGHIVRWYFLLTEVDDRKLAEDELRRSEARRRVVVETANDAVVDRVVPRSGAIPSRHLSILAVGNPVPALRCRY